MRVQTILAAFIYNLQWVFKMKARNIKRSLLGFALGSMVLLSSFLQKERDYPGLRIICNAYSEVSDLKQSEFEHIIRGEQQRWKGGEGVTIALLKTSHPVGLKTAQSVFDMGANEFNRYWLSLVFEGKCKAPVFFNSEAALKDFIMLNQGAIGIVSAELGTSGVRVLNIKDQ